jgi:hypothetical protein
MFRLQATIIRQTFQYMDMQTLNMSSPRTEMSAWWCYLKTKRVANLHYWIYCCVLTERYFSWKQFYYSHAPAVLYLSAFLKISLITCWVRLSGMGFDVVDYYKLPIRTGNRIPIVCQSLASHWTSRVLPGIVLLWNGHYSCFRIEMFQVLITAKNWLPWMRVSCVTLVYPSEFQHRTYFRYLAQFIIYCHVIERYAYRVTDSVVKEIKHK